MALKKITENPKVTDTILLEIETPDSYGCLTSNPYRVDSVIIYYVERDFLGNNFGEYVKLSVDPILETKLNKAQKNLCLNPSADNISIVQKILSQIESSVQSSTFYYRDKVVVKTIGDPNYPAWLSSNTAESPFVLEDTDADGNPQYGVFSYEWNPDGSIREGDYFMCWTWTPHPAGEKLSAHIQFSIEGDPNAVMTIPTHVTIDGKYETLLERYLPEMYKLTLSDSDRTPETLDLFNKSVAQGFTFLEDMANQIIDLFDANALHESLLTFLSNLFNLKLKSDDPTLWRRQIKEAVPLFKKKGTLNGLKGAFAQAGMNLTKFTQYWQLVSPYTWIEEFTAIDSAIFVLSKPDLITPIDDNNFGLWIKRFGEINYTQLSKDYVSFDTNEAGEITMTWIGDELSVNSLNLLQGDVLKVLYQFKVIPNDNAQQLENYIQSLPLADQREEKTGILPLKNWNVHIIDDRDPLFSVLIPVRNPFQDPVIFGFIRTEFAFSENIYNMEEYNGSTRPSLDPCHIDSKFIDGCGQCLSSIYSVDLEIQQLSNDTMLEAQEILREFTPFHAQLHSLNLSGEVNELVPPPVETIECLITVDYSQFIISGNANPFFHRMMQDSLLDPNFIVDRQQLTDEVTVVSSDTGNAYNETICVISPDVSLYNSGISNINHVFEVLSPSSNAGTYSLLNIQGNTATVNSTVNEPVDESAFTFNVTNILYANNLASITQDNLCLLTDTEVDFDLLSVMSLWDVAHTANYTGGTWTVLIPAYSATPYEINNVTAGVASLKDTNTLPTTSISGVSYTLYNDIGDIIATSTTGDLTIKQRGYVNLNDSDVLNLSDVLKVGDGLYYNGFVYNVSELYGSNNFWIDDYNDGNIGGAIIQIRRPVITNAIGYFGYKGLNLTTNVNYESQLGIINGHNPPSEDNQTDNNLFKENFMFLIDGNYYKIAQINGTEIILSGREQSWTTQDFGGTDIAFSIVHFSAKQVNVGFIVFDQLNRNGKDPIIREIESDIDNTLAIVALSMPRGSGMQENIAQEESISFVIETRDGTIQEGTI